MVPALTLDELNKQVKKRYEYGEQRVFGIMLARYSIHRMQNIIHENYDYWHKNTSKFMDIYWAGYGEWLWPEDQSSTKTILNYPGNTTGVYFDMEAFIEIKDQLEESCKIPYNDTMKLVLVNYHDGQIHFDENIMIDLEQNLDVDNVKIREIMEFVRNECRREYEVTPIARKLKMRRMREKIKGVTLSDAINTSISVVGLM